MLRRWCLLTLYVCLSWLAVAQPARAQTTETVVQLPANLQLPRELQVEVAALWQRSPIFRGQCERIAAARFLTVKLQYLLHSAHQLRSYRALTTYKRNADGTAEAFVRVGTNGPLPELIGHELEHVLEQLEGLPLRRLAAYANTNVSRTDDDVYETERARVTGRQVFDEWLAAQTLPRRAPRK